MGGSSSTVSESGCRILDERSTFILVRNYVVILKMISYIDSILDGNADLFNYVKTNFTPYLVDAEAMLEFLKELPIDISTTFAPTEQKVVGVKDGKQVTKEVSFYDSYNDFFLVEQLNFDTLDEAKDRIKEISNNLKKKSEVVESLITQMCVKEIGA